MENITLSVIAKRSDDTTIEVSSNGKRMGYIHRFVREVPARRVFYPCTTSKVVWYGRKCDGNYSEYPTRKAAVAAIVGVVE